MQFGVGLPTSSGDDTKNLRTGIIETAKAAESLGYESIWANDVVVLSTSRGWPNQPIEPLITLASLVHLVPQIKLGTSVLALAQRNAFVVAKQAAALDLLSEGRFILGVGVGWREDEFVLLNADFSRRGVMTDEAISVLRTLWRDTVASFHGQFYHFSDANLLPKPTGGGLPLWVGGNTPSAIRRAAQVGDAWVPFGIRIEDFRAGVAALRERTKGWACPTIAAVFVLRVDRGASPTPTHRPVDPDVSHILVAAQQRLCKSWTNTVRPVLST